MKKILLLLLIIVSTVSYSQTIRSNRVVVENSIYLRNRWIDTVLNEVGNTNLLDRSKTLLTANAVNEILGKYSQNEMDVFMIQWQSNAKGRGEDSTISPNPVPNTVYEYFNGSFQMVINEVGNPDQSSAWPSFGITYYNLTGRKICFVQTAVSGTGVLYRSNPSNGSLHWGDGGSLFDSSINRVDSALVAIAAAGYKPKFRGIISIGGETDGLAINAGTVTKQEFKDSTRLLIQKYQQHFGKGAPFYICKIGTRVATDDTGFGYVRDVNEELATEDPENVVIIFRGAFDFPTRGLMRTGDAFHYSSLGNNELGRVAAGNLVASTGNNWQYDASGNATFRQGTVLSKKISGGIETTSSLTLQSTTGTGTTGADIIMKVGSNGATEAMRILNNGRIGFGTANPSLKWEYNSGGANGGMRLFSGNTANYQYLGIGRTADDLILSSGANADALFFTNVLTNDISIRSKAGRIHIGVGPGIEPSTMIFTGSPYQVGIGTTTGAVASAKLEVSSTTMGFLTPRMTTGQKTAITSPANGLEVFDTDLNEKNVYTAGEWQHVATTSATKNGTATLSSGTVTVNTTAIKAGSIVLVVHNTISGTQGILSVPVASYTAGTSFVINSSDVADNSTVNWWIIN